MLTSSERPKIGLTALVMKEGKLLLGRRAGSKPGTGMYQTPGGHLEHLESFEECIKRELKEEVDIEVENIKLLSVTNVRRFPPAHFVVISFTADWKSGEPTNVEPEHCEGWDWFDLAALPQPMTPASEAGVKAFLNQGNLFEATIEEGLKSI